MKIVFSILACQVATITCIICAYLALMAGNDQWYWFIVISLFVGVRAKSDDNNKKEY